MNVLIYIIAGPLFLVSIIAHICVKLYLRPKDDSDFDDYYHEFEDSHPGFARYTKWSKITFTAAAVSVLLLFLAAVL